jgi:hypothetical protein
MDVELPAASAIPALIARYQAFQQFAPESPPELVKNFKKDVLGQPF